MKTKPEKIDGFTLTEVLISSAIFSVVSLGLLMGFTSLERSFSAATDFATKHSDEMRISDYLALDLRRAFSVQAAQNNTTIAIPSYYDANRTPQLPQLDGTGVVYYGPLASPTPPSSVDLSLYTIHIRYYLQGSTIYRQQIDNPSWYPPGSVIPPPIPVAENVKDFVFDVTDLGKVVTTRITFNPTFRSGGASADAITATALYNTTLLRNSLN